VAQVRVRSLDANLGSGDLICEWFPQALRESCAIFAVKSSSPRPLRPFSAPSAVKSFPHPIARAKSGH
jgi:hypothetical protein